MRVTSTTDGAPRHTRNTSNSRLKQLSVLPSLKLRRFKKHYSQYWSATMSKSSILKRASETVLSELCTKRSCGELDRLVLPEEFLQRFKDATAAELEYISTPEKQLQKVLSDLEVSSKSALQRVSEIEKVICDSSADLVLLDKIHVELEASIEASPAFETMRDLVLQLSNRLLESHEALLASKTTLLHLEEVSKTDPLTKIRNRRAFTEDLHEIHNSGPYTVIHADLDFFKSVNDTFGHQVGDEVLEVIAKRLASAIKTTDRVYRLGGDEFAILLPGVSDVKLAETVTKRIQTMVCAEPITLHGVSFPASVSVGCAVGNPLRNSAEVNKLADDRLYTNKERPERLRARDTFDRLRTTKSSKKLS